MICNYNNTWKYQKKFPKNFKKNPGYFGIQSKQLWLGGFQVESPNIATGHTLPSRCSRIKRPSNGAHEFPGLVLSGKSASIIGIFIGSPENPGSWAVAASFWMGFCCRVLARNLDKNRKQQNHVFSHHPPIITGDTPCKTCHFQPYQLLRVIDGLPWGEKTSVESYWRLSNFEQATSLEKRIPLIIWANDKLSFTYPKKFKKNPQIMGVQSLSGDGTAQLKHINNTSSHSQTSRFHLGKQSRLNTLITCD